MGIMPVPITPGNNCLLCWPPGETPDMFKLFFGGIKTGTAWHAGDLAPPNGYWDITQSVAAACSFTLVNPDAVTGVTFGIGASACWFQRPASMNSFFANPAIECTKSFTNALQNPLGKFYSGWAFIATPAQMQEWIAMVTPIVGPDPRMELFPMDNDEIVLKFCNKQDATNIKIKVDTALL